MSYHITPEGNVAECKANQGRCPFGKPNDHFDTKEAAVKAFEAQNESQTLPAPTVKPVSSTMLKNSSYEVGFAARSYFRLLNHQNYDQAKELYGKVKDAEVIEAVKESHRASIAILDLEEQLTKAQNRLSNAKTSEQKAGYTRNADAVALKLTQAIADFDTAEERVNKLKAKYSKELAIHNNSLKALERLAESDKPLVRPEGIARRIGELKNARKGLKTIKPVTDKLGRGNFDQTVEAAEAYGNSYYTESAKTLRETTLEKETLDEEQARLKVTLSQTENKAVKDTVLSEISKNEYAIHRLIPAIRAAEPRVSLFKDEIRDRKLHENDLSRELNALIKIEARTR